MKKYFLIFISFILLCCSKLSFGQQEKPIEVSSFIGSTLDKVERDFFNLLPAIEGFEEAYFYLNTDNSLKAVIKLNNNGVASDTIIERYSSPHRLESHIMARILLDVTNDEENIVAIKSKNGMLENQKLFTINDEKLFSINQKLLGHKKTDPNFSMLNELDLSEVDYVKLPRTSFLNYTLYGVATGSMAGLLIGLYYGLQNWSEQDSKFAKTLTLLSPLETSLYGILIGTGVGLVGGTIIGAIFGEDDQLIDPNTPSGLAKMKPYVYFTHRYKMNEVLK